MRDAAVFLRTAGPRPIGHKPVPDKPALAWAAFLGIRQILICILINVIQTKMLHVNV